MRKYGDWTSAVVLLAAVAIGGCAKRVWVPARIDLQSYGPVGLVTFTIENAKGSLHDLATERFAAEIFAGQDRVEILELGDAEELLGEVGRDDFDARTAQAIGEAYGIPAVFVGHLKVSDVRPRASLIDLRFPHAEAAVTVEIAVRLYSAENGATLWSNSARASETVGALGLVDGDVYFSAENPNEAYGRLVDHLIYDLTYDFRPAYVRQ